MTRGPIVDGLEVALEQLRLIAGDLADSKQDSDAA